MTGLECLKAELLERGYNKRQIENKVILETLEILSNSQGRYTDLDKLEKEISDKQEILALLNYQISYLTRTYDDLCHNRDKAIESVKKIADREYKAVIDYIDAFLKILEDCNSPEKRDIIKLAQMYRNSVNIETPYDNTAFIKGLAAILSQGAATLEGGMKKIDPDLIPKLKIDVWESGYSIESVSGKKRGDD